ncbi:MAG: epoxyqueuosine reductase QueH [Clostridia bacterium]|nr:epoxyqueuosine reductase QueH [Clostridia bacterium]
MKVNYKRLMDAEIEKLKATGKKPTLLLHACCAPCSSAVLEVLSDVFDITLFFYNPNISPESEFYFRLDELKRLTDEMNLSDIGIIAPEYNDNEFFKITEGLENLAEGGARCKKCYRLRISKSVEYAKANGFDYVTTTLSISPHKNADWLNEIGTELSDKAGIKYLCSDFKKGEGYKRSCDLSKIYNLYRQDYCGCVYSKNLQKEKMQK